MFKIHNLIIILSFIAGSYEIYATQNQSSTNHPMSNKSTIVKTEDTIQHISINTADITTLQKIKGFGKKKAEAVVEYRNKNGTFKSVEELLKIKARGLNQKWLDKIGKFVTI